MKDKRLGSISSRFRLSRASRWSGCVLPLDRRSRRLLKKPLEGGFVEFSCVRFTEMQRS